MRSLVVLALVVGCKKEGPKPTATGSAIAPGDGAAAVAATDAGVPADAAPPALVDLFRAVRTSIGVSSRVANPKIKGEHLVDRDLNTAWNSRTGELIGAWLEIQIPRDSVMHELRLTAGHTGKGPKGEDYFTMNPRIERVVITHGAKRIGVFPLDITKRELQTIALPALTGASSLRVTVDAIEMGSKAKWREVCISELELWGVPPAGTTLPGTLTPHVYEATSATLDDLCEELVPDPDPDYPECTIDTFGFALDAPWGAPALLRHVTHRSEHHGHLYNESAAISLVTVINGRPSTGPIVDQTGFEDDGSGKKTSVEVTIEDAKTEDAIPGGAKELVTRIRITTTETEDGKDTETEEEVVVVCAPDRRCSKPIPADSYGKSPPVLE